MFKGCIVDGRETLQHSVPVITFLNVQFILKLSCNSIQRAESPTQRFHLIGFEVPIAAAAYIMVSKERE